ncbi:hypothetical protein DICSQDRAFT_157220 [Dichomitus squalens LYAD-421 SS1]|uniref:Late embryogenesis abundant protein n=1 Tax=Dichomitus squalens (strain LYAD-421) TaxID=732165 RepID=R7SNW1_DICSQ|nr:uncharacterized protein DICSQDRAFT_157220 [Dichomitus squalens LYAD-421 SS1]EJF57618.1 hypothetical protein DICSQDRAFT_157220 [Dichomitus squalens LYAD-421 SS1]
MSAVLRTTLRAAPAASRAACSRPRTYATVPDPTQPTDTQTDIPKPKGNTTLFLVAGGLAAAGASYYYVYQSGSADPHAQRQADQERVKQKAAELRDAGKATAHDAAREGQAKYDETKSSAQDKLAEARAQTNKTADDARGAATRQYEKVKGTAADAAHKVEQTYEDAAKKTKQEAQGWNAWLWSWLGYSQKKAEDVKSEGAQKVAEGARKVEQEAQKRV